MVEPTHLKNMLVKMDHFPNFRDENLPPPSQNLSQNHIAITETTEFTNQCARPKFYTLDRKTTSDATIAFFSQRVWLKKNKENPHKIHYLCLQQISSLYVHTWAPISPSQTPRPEAALAPLGRTTIRRVDLEPFRRRFSGSAVEKIIIFSML